MNSELLPMLIQLCACYIRPRKAWISVGCFALFALFSPTGFAHAQGKRLEDMSLEELLKPELTTTYEIGLKSVRQSMQNSVAFFRQDIFQRIDVESITPSDPNSDVIYRNVGTETIQGVELKAPSRSCPVCVRSTTRLSCLPTTATENRSKKRPIAGSSSG